MNRKIITKGFYQHENGSKTITYWCGKPTPLGVGWIALDT